MLNLEAFNRLGHPTAGMISTSGAGRPKQDVAKRPVPAGALDGEQGRGVPAFSVTNCADYAPMLGKPAHYACIPSMVESNRNLRMLELK